MGFLDKFLDAVKVNDDYDDDDFLDDVDDGFEDEKPKKDFSKNWMMISMMNTMIFLLQRVIKKLKNSLLQQKLPNIRNRLMRLQKIQVR